MDNTFQHYEVVKFLALRGGPLSEVIFSERLSFQGYNYSLRSYTPHDFGLRKSGILVYYHKQHFSIGKWATEIHVK